MAEELENNGEDKVLTSQESPDQPGSGDQDADDHSGLSEDGDTPSGKRGKPNKKGVWGYKYILGGLIVVIFAATWASSRFGSELLKMVYKKEQLIHLSDIEMENLTEEILQPIFIPLGKHAAEGVMRIDFSVIWDGLASVRYNKMRLLIRDRLFRDISTVAIKIEEPEKEGEILENQMGSILREMLGINNLFIKVKEINYF